MSEFEIVKSEYNALGEDNNYKTHYLKTSADQVVGLGRMKSFSYAVGDVVCTDSNLSVALKCVTAGTTSNTELDISGRAVGESVEDGSVVWEVIDRDYTKDYERIASRVQPIELGGTGAQTVIDALKNLDLLSADGKLSFGGAYLPIKINYLNANEYNDIEVMNPSYSIEGGYGQVVFYHGNANIVLQWAPFDIPAGTANTGATAYIPYPISAFFVGGVNCNSYNGMKVEWYGEVDNMVTVYKGAGDSERRYGTFWVLGVAK